MRADTKPRPTELACSFTTFLSALDNPAPAFVGIPRSLRDHIGQRELGDFGAVLLAERPVSDDLSAHVARWRASDAARRDDAYLRPHPDQIADDRRFNILFVLTPMAIMIMVLTGLIGAWLKGAI
jgi:hypothetical protein